PAHHCNRSDFPKTDKTPLDINIRNASWLQLFLRHKDAVAQGNGHFRKKSAVVHSVNLATRKKCFQKFLSLSLFWRSLNCSAGPDTVGVSRFTLFCTSCDNGEIPNGQARRRTQAVRLATRRKIREPNAGRG